MRTDQTTLQGLALCNLEEPLSSKFYEQTNQVVSSAMSFYIRGIISAAEVSRQVLPEAVRFEIGLTGGFVHD